MRYQGPRGLIAIAAIVALLGGVVRVPVVAAQTPDKSDVVLVLDFSASILEQAADRNRFAAALERIADRVAESSAELVTGDTTMSIVQFAAKAIDYPGCSQLKLLNNPAAVTTFANCLRSVASAYRKGLDARLTRRIGIDTNYVAAMERAATHLPAAAVRPAMILFTDGRHDLKGVPAWKVRVTRDRLFAARTPFALLPVGMGLDPAKRAELERGLAALRIVKDMPPCVSGTTFSWPTLVFESPDEAGNAVAVALENATCTFTVEPAPPPPPLPGVVRDVRLTARDSAIDLEWAAPTTNAEQVVGYQARCRAGEGDWIEVKPAQPSDTKASIEGLTNGLSYSCEVAAIGATGPGPWTASAATVMPLGRPATPAKPAVEALDGGIRISVPPTNEPALSGYRYQCSDDGGGTWRDVADVDPANPTAQVANLTNGVPYVCRAYAVNATGLSEPSAPSDAVMPCGSFLECNSLLTPVLGVLGVLAALGLLAVFVALFRERRRRGYVIAVVDVVHSTNLGHGSNLGIRFVRDPESKRVTGVEADRRPRPDVRIRHLRGERFEVIDWTGRRVTQSGEPVIAVDPDGGRHQLVLQAFDTTAAADVARRA